MRIFFCYLIMIFTSSPLSADASHKKFPQKEQKPFVIGGLLGQLGNKLFQVATTCALAWDNDAEAYFPDFLPIKDYSTDFHHIFFRCNTTPPSKRIEFEFGVPPFGYTPIPFHPNMKISGYFQNEKYFAHHRDKLINLFAPNRKDLKYIKTKYASILSHPNSVSVHLRYYLREKPDEESFIQYDKEYFDKAMAHFPDDSLFVVTSDNINFAKDNISTNKKNVIFIENEPYYIDFHLQSLCKHNIICNSSFSWWSAWLNKNPNKIVIRPKNWLGGYEDIGGPDNWIQIEAKGVQEKRNIINLKNKL